MSYNIPQVNISPNGELIPNPGENLVSTYRDVHYDKWEGEIYITDLRLVWIGLQHKGGLLGKLAKAAVVAGVAVAAGYAASKVSARVGIPSRIGGLGGGALAGLTVASLMSKHPDGSPTTISVPYEVVSSIQIGKNKNELILATEVGGFTFRFEKGGADTVATVVKAQHLNATKRVQAQAQAPAAPSYQQPPPYQQPAPAYAQPAPQRGQAFYCPHCGTPLEPGARFCHNCGARID
ncbi:MAG: zinc ribbon domain-containing protein [Promethearchaeati archaeon SRVP18_Atabeyarchaeia-1]